MFCKIQVKILVNGEERISPWANYVLQPPRENQVILHIFCVRVICTIFKGFEGTAFAQHMWSPAADEKQASCFKDMMDELRDWTLTDFGGYKDLMDESVGMVRMIVGVAGLPGMHCDALGMQ